MMNKKEAIHYYEELHKELNSIICEWDPYGLSEKGRISDEFSEEVTRVLAGLRNVNDNVEATDLVSKVFSKAFSPEDFGHEACKEVGIKIFQWWVKKG